MGSMVEKSGYRKVVEEMTHGASFPLWSGDPLKQPEKARSCKENEQGAAENLSLIPLLALGSVIFG